MKGFVFLLAGLLVFLAACVETSQYRTSSLTNAMVTPFCADNVVCYGDYKIGGGCFRDTDLVEKYCPKTEQSQSQLSGPYLIEKSYETKWECKEAVLFPVEKLECLLGCYSFKKNNVTYWCGDWKIEKEEPEFRIVFEPQVCADLRNCSLVMYVYYNGTFVPKEK